MYPITSKLVPPWQKEAAIDASCSLPQKTNSLSAAFRKSLNSMSVFYVHIAFLFSPEARLQRRP